MTYNVNYTDNSKTPLVVDDGDINIQTSIGLIGKKYSRYGEAVSENFLHLLENFANSATPTNPTEGQLWYDNANNIMKYYTSNENWKVFANVFTGGSQPTTLDSKLGDIWVNTTTNTVLVYVNNTWVELGSGGGSSVDPEAIVTNGIATRTRYDNVGATHKTLEIVVNAKTVAIYSSDDTTWIPASTGINVQYIEGSTSILLFSQFPTIKKGINLNPTGTVKYDIHNFSVTQLGAVTINTGRGDVYLATNDYDDADGAGLTFKTSADPINGSIFSIRNSSHSTKLWAGQSLTSAGVNDFYVGFTGALGSEYDSTKYNIKLDKNGNIIANSISGNWVATNVEAAAGAISNKIMTPATTKTLLDSYNFVPSGAIMAFAMNAVPVGWLSCDGTAISRTTYAALFTAINTAYGAGNGTTTFNLPDFRGTFLRGYDAGKGVDIGRVFASYQADELKSHNHTITDPGHFHTIGTDDNDAGGTTTIDGSNTVAAQKPTSTTTTGITINATGGVETRPKNYAILYCIKT